MMKKSVQKKEKLQNIHFKEKSYSDLHDLVKKDILGVGVTVDTKENILKYIIDFIKNSTENCYIVTPNPEMIVLGKKNREFRDALNGAKIALNDGVGLSLAARTGGISLGERFTGVEMVEKLSEVVSDWPITVGFLGGGRDVAEKTAECLVTRFPNLKVAFAGQEWPKGYSGKKEVVNKKEKQQTAKYRLQKTDVIDILFVAFGAPKQELWMKENLKKIPVRVMIGVGGAFDQIVDPTLRPPKFIQSIGLGWLYRLMRQPWRIKRQLALIEFVGIILRGMLRK